MAKKIVVRAAPKAPPVVMSTEKPRNEVRRDGARKPPPLDLEHDGEEHRQFPRAKMRVHFEAWIDREDERVFAASFHSANLSVSGAFLESTFFLPVGTEIRVSFDLEDNPEPVQARAQIVRVESPNPRTGEGRSGIAIRFVEFFGQTEVTLARLFLGDKLRDFSERYMASKRARALNNELDRVVDALAAWELLKVTQPGDPWRPTT
jgi:hypothetical protein